MVRPSILQTVQVIFGRILSGGLFREMCRVMRIAIDNAQAASRTQIVIGDVNRAEAELRNEFRRFLDLEQRNVLKEVRADNELRRPSDLGLLFQALAVLEYRNDENWCDAHPALYLLLDEESSNGNAGNPSS